MPKPAVADAPRAFFKAIHGAGITHVLSLLSHEDIARLNLEQEAEWCNDVGIHFSHYPIVDFSVPNSPSAFLNKAQELHKAITSGQHWVIHCHGGIGRSGMMAVALLIHEGYPPEQAIEKVSNARGVPVPDTPEQKEFLLRLAP